MRRMKHKKEFQDINNKLNLSEEKVKKNLKKHLILFLNHR